MHDQVSHGRRVRVRYLVSSLRHCTMIHLQLMQLMQLIHLLMILM